MFGPVVVLDGNGFRHETDRLQRLLQRVPGSCGAEGRNSNRNVRFQRCESSIISVAATLSWALSNTNGSMSTNSPETRSRLMDYWRKHFAPLHGYRDSA